MSCSLPSGFTNTPVSKYAAYATLALPLVASLTSTKYIYYLSYEPFIVPYHQLWRILTYQVAFVNESDVILGLVLLYQFRSLERLYSAHKYLSMIIVLYLYNILIVTLWTSVKFYTLLKPMNGISSGPVSIIFGLLFQYREHIPTIYKFEIYGTGNNKIVLTDQFLIYLLSFQLLISQGFKSIASGILGWILGDLIVRSVLPGKNWRLPLFKRISKEVREETPALSTTDDEDAAETRPLSTQFLDVLRR